MIDLATWNIRGLNSPFKKREMHVFIKKNNKLCVVDNLKTKIKAKNIIKTSKNIFGDWHYVHNGDVCPRERILLGWENNLAKVNIVDKMDQAIYCEVQDSNI